MRATKIDDSGSVLIQHKKIQVWVDVWKEGEEFFADWNQYIFFLTDKNDIKVKLFQENCNNFDEATSLAIEFYKKNK